MAFINKYSGIIIVVLIIAVVVLSALLIAQNSGTPSPSPTTAPIPTSTSTTSASGTPAQAAENQTSTKSNVPSAPRHSAASSGIAPATTGFVIRLVNPIPGEIWIIAQQNLISWDREAGVAGQIELLDAATYKLVGVILNQIGPSQTSYTWNTRDLLLSRNNPAKTTVVPGQYVVRIAFDGNNLSPITSQPITITQ